MNAQFVGEKAKFWHASNLDKKQVQAYVEANYAKDISLNGLADLVNFSPYYLTRVFRDEVGLPPHAYLTQVRIAQAKKRLVYGQ